MEVQVEEKDEVVVFRISGRLDAASSPQLEKKISSIIDSGHFRILLDLANVEYLSSAGMRLMLSISKRLKNIEGKIVACSLNDEVMDVIRMAGFDQVLEVYPTEAAALTNL